MPFMKTIEEIRIENLKILIKDFGGEGVIAEKIEKAPAQISQWKNASPDSKTGKPRGMSPEACRLIEEKCSKEIGWMDNQHLSPETTDEDELLNSYRAANPKSKIAIMQIVKSVAQVSKGSDDLQDGT
jgi:hypothetical protein